MLKVVYASLKVFYPNSYDVMYQNDIPLPFFRLSFIKLPKFLASNLSALLISVHKIGQFHLLLYYVWLFGLCQILAKVT